MKPSTLFMIFILSPGCQASQDWQDLSKSEPSGEITCNILETKLNSLVQQAANLHRRLKSASVLEKVQLVAKYEEIKQGITRVQELLKSNNCQTPKSKSI
jgi:hypothetical protein